MKTSEKKPLRRAVSFLLGGLTCGWLVYYFIEHPEELRLLRNVDFNLASAILALQIVRLFCQSRRFQIVVEACSNRSLQALAWMRYFVVGRILNFVGPKLGMVYRGLHLKRKFGVPYTKYIGSALFVNWLDACVNTLIMVVLIASTDPFMVLGGVVMLWILVAFLALLVIAPFLVEAVLGGIPALPARLQWAKNKVREALSVVAHMWLRKRRVLRILGWTVSSAVFDVAAFFLCFLALGIEITAGQLVVYYTVLKFGSLVAITPGNVGIRELLFGLVSELMGSGMGAGILVASLARLLGLLALCLSGGVLVLLARAGPAKRLAGMKGT